jgi:hypothetical protein
METTSTPEATFRNVFVRKRGMTTFVVGSIIFVLLVSTMDWLSVGGHSILVALIPTCVSFAIAAAGFLEVVSGEPCHRLRRTWAGLRIWQRGMIGIFIAVTSLVVLVCLATFFMILFA